MKTKNSKKSLLVTTLDKLSHQDYEIRMRAVEKLGTLLSGDSPPRKLVEMLADDEELVRVAVAESLGHIGNRSVLPDLWKGLGDASSLVRRYVAQAIGKLGDGADAERLERQLKQEKNESSRVGIYEALYRLGKDKYLFDLIGLLKSRDYRVRCAVANALSDIMDDRYLAKFILNILQEATDREPTIAARSSLTSSIRFINSHIKRLDSRK